MPLILSNEQQMLEDSVAGLLQSAAASAGHDDKARFEIFRMVCGQDGLTAAELSAGKAASTTSHHLAKLENAGVLHARRVGKTKRYSVDVA